MNAKNNSQKKPVVRVMLYVLSAVILLSAGIGIGYYMHPQTETAEQTGYVSNPAYEYMVGAAAWQMSAEAHALMMQGFHLAEKNIDENLEAMNLEYQQMRQENITTELLDVVSGAEALRMQKKK